MKIRLNSLGRRQRGTVLLISLVFILLLVMISSASMRSATLQTRLASNGSDRLLAFQAAEAALRQAEILLEKGSIAAFDGSGGGYQSCPQAGDSRLACQIPDWHQPDSSGWRLADMGESDLSRPAEFYIEQIQGMTVVDPVMDADRTKINLDIYRITARGFGQSEASVVVLASVFYRAEEE